MKRGFTLIELVVVLVVLAVLAHLAVRELSHVRAGKLRAAANRQLEEVAAAVWTCAADGEPFGFLADVGRLPRPVEETNGVGVATLTLAELWRRPESLSAYALLPATAENLRVPESEKAQLADARLLVPTGWRGPYLRLPIDRTRLLDPWGNPLEGVDDAGHERLAIEDDRIVAVTHLGSDARPDAEGAPTDETARDATLSLAPSGGVSSRLALSAEFPAGDAPATIDWKWYGPCEGAITGAVARAVDPLVQTLFEGLTPGVRFVTDSYTKGVHRVTVRPGDNLVHLKLHPAAR